jgi:hypothetical protein
MTVGGPIRVGRNVRNDDALSSIGGRAAGALLRPDRGAVERARVLGRQVRRGPVAKMRPLQEQDRAQHSRRLAFNQANDRVERRGQRSAHCDLLQHLSLSEVKRVHLGPHGLESTLWRYGADTAPFGMRRNRPTSSRFRPIESETEALLAHTRLRNGCNGIGDVWHLLTSLPGARIFLLLGERWMIQGSQDGVWKMPSHPIAEGAAN